MAEKFVKPTRYTKEWWGYIWDYYKAYFWTGVFILGAVLLTVMQSMGQPKYLMNTIYAGTIPVLDEPMKTMLYDISTDLSDEENDGIMFTQLNFNYDDTADIEYTVAMEQKLSLEFFVNETMLYMFDETKYRHIRNAENLDNVWLPISEWAEEMPDEALLVDEYALKLKNSALLKEYGIDGENIYLAVRKCYDEKDNKAMKKYEYSKIIANKLIKE